MRTIIKIAAVWMLLAAATPAFSQVHLNITFGPPAPRQEIIVAQPSPNAVWVAGYYQYNALTGAYAWVPGHWAYPPAAQQTWVAPRYVRHGNHYDYYAGG